MKISFFNTFLDGGAASAAIGLYTSLGNEPLDKVFYYSRNIKQNIREYKYNTFVQRDYCIEPKRVFQKITDSMRARRHYGKLARSQMGRPEGYEQFSFSKQYYKTPYSFFGELPDVIHLHWIAEWLDYPSFFNSIPNDVPIVWTLHDMNAFTGGCHYSWDCEQYVTACQFCPQLGPEGNGSLVNESWLTKLDSLRNKNLHVVADSYWLEKEAVKSRILKDATSFRTIHYGVDEEIFKPIKVARLEDKFRIAFGAASLDNRRKGFEVLRAALKLLYNKHSHIECVVFGKGAASLHDDGLPPFISVGHITDPSDLAKLYCSSDVFIIPSLYEAFGQTSLEAMACAIPVLGFDVGGIPDTVIHGETGLLIRPGDVQDLAEKIEYMIFNPRLRQKMGQQARAKIEKNFLLKDQAEKYFQLYESILKK